MASATRAVVVRNTYRQPHPELLALTVEDVAADTFAHGHAQVDIQSDARDAHAGIVLVLGDEVCVVMVVVMAVVRVARVAARLRLRRAHGG